MVLYPNAEKDRVVESVASTLTEYTPCASAATPQLVPSTITFANGIA